MLGVPPGTGVRWYAVPALAPLWGKASLGTMLPCPWHASRSWRTDTALTQLNGLANDFSNYHQPHQPGWLSFPHILFFGTDIIKR